MTNLNPGMDAIDTMLDFDASYMCGTNDYIDTTSSSESTSPSMTSFEIPIIPGVAEFGAMSSEMYPSPTSSTRESASPQPTIKQEEKSAPADEKKGATKAPAKRKRENRYKNAPPSVLSRRRAQNRASQRAYRERKDQRIKDLEVMLDESKQKQEALTEAYSNLHSEFMKFRNAHAQQARRVASHHQQQHHQQQHHHHHQQQQQQRHASINIPFDLSPSSLSPGTPMSAMPMLDGWQMFSEPLSSYVL